MMTHGVLILSGSYWWGHSGEPLPGIENHWKPFSLIYHAELYLLVATKHSPGYTQEHDHGCRWWTIACHICPVEQVRIAGEETIAKSLGRTAECVQWSGLPLIAVLHPWWLISMHPPSFWQITHPSVHQSISFMILWVEEKTFNPYKFALLRPLAMSGCG